MNIRNDFDGFRWAKGRYTLSPDRQLILRDPDVPMTEYTPDGSTLEAIARGAHEADGALALAQLVGFLTVDSHKAAEPVSAFLEAAGELLLHPLDDFPMPIPEPNLPPEWKPSMGNLRDEAKLSDGRTLTGKAARAHQLAVARNEARAAHERKMKANPPSPGWAAKREAEILASYFNVRARFRVRAKVELEDDQPVLVLSPFALRDWCWYRLAGAATGTVRKKKCCMCDTWFDVDLTDDRRAGRLYCSGACKAKGFRQMKKRAKTKRAGRTPGNRKRERR